jgi:hypothetical protein
MNGSTSSKVLSAVAVVRILDFPDAAVRQAIGTKWRKQKIDFDFDFLPAELLLVST